MKGRVQDGNGNICQTFLKSAFRSNSAAEIAVLRFLEGLRPAGVYHLMLNLKYSKRNAAEVLEKIGRHLVSQLEASQNHPGRHIGRGRGS